MTNQERIEKLKQAEKLVREVEFSYPQDDKIRKTLYRAVVQGFGFGSPIAHVIQWIKNEIQSNKTLEQFLSDNRADMFNELTSVVADLKLALADLKNLGSSVEDQGSIDIRLCVDTADTRHGYGDTNVGFTWIFRTGDASYDQRHSQWCAASSVGLDTDAAELLQELIDQIGE